MKLSEFNVRHATLDAMLAEKAQRIGTKVFLNNLADGRQFTYAQLDKGTLRIGNGLLAAGVSFGAHVGVLMENCPEQLLAMWGVCRAGMVTVPINTGAKGQLLTHFLGHSDCVAVIVERALLNRVLEVAPELPMLVHIFVAEIERADTAAMGEVSDAIAPQPNLGLPPRATMGNFAELLAAPATPLTHPPKFTDTAILMFTSGTTGPSKANVFCQAQLIYYGTDVGEHHEYVPEDIAYVYLPLFHGNAFLGSTMGSFMADGSIALATRFSITRFWSDVHKSGATIFNCLSSIVNYLWNAPPSEDDRKHKVWRVHLAPVPGFALEFEERFGVRILSAYALTDFGMGTYYNAQSRRDKLGSVGQPRANVELRVVDDDDLDMPAGKPGEIILRHKLPWCSTLGYYNAPAATLASRRNLWFHTGDRGVLDADGYLWFTDRLKDAIRRRGENISAYEVEEAIRSHADVEDVAVYPVKAESSEDEVAASVILKAGATLDEEGLVRHCNRNLAYFMVPRYVELVTEFPRTPNSKIEKHKLRAKAEADLAALWDRERAGIMVTRDGISRRPPTTTR